ncbi:MAG TPA: ATP-grasp domain-containing protein [Planctomycetota bacterium]
MKRRVLVVFPTAWDERQLANLPETTRARYELVLDEPGDAEARWDIDLLAYVDERARRWRGRLDGVFSSSDYPGAAVAAALAAELGLPGPSPAAVLRAGHKLLARELQRAAVPEVVPRFAAFDPGDERTWPPEQAFPCFAKPVRGSYSLHARPLASRAELAAYAAAPALREFQQYYPCLGERLAERYEPAARAARLFLAEERLSGLQATFEGYLRGGRLHPLGVVDTEFHPGTRSFAAFDLPSRLPEEVQARMAHAAGAAARALGLEDTLFNAEFLWDAERERLGLIELNPRLCGQFGDLYAKVHGVHGYAVALALACGEEPPRAHGAGPCAAAASLPLRTFRSVRVAHAPTPEELRAAEALFPHTLAWSDCRTGDELCVGPTLEDGASARYAVLNLGGASRAELRACRARLETTLGYRFTPP